MFGKPADALDDDENEKLDAAFRQQNGDDSEDEEDDSDEDEDRTEVIMKGKPSAKEARKAKKFMRRLKFPARLAAWHKQRRADMRSHNLFVKQRRKAPGYSVPEDEDDTEFEYDSEEEDEAPPFNPAKYFKSK